MIERLVDTEQLNKVELKAIAEEFHGEARLGGSVDINSIMRMLRMILDTRGIGALFVLREGGVIRGIIGGMIVPGVFTDDVIVSEIFWFVSKKDRGGLGGIRLKKELEKWAKDVGADWIHMGVMAKGSASAKVEELYQRTGYEVLETVYRKKVA